MEGRRLIREEFLINTVGVQAEVVAPDWANLTVVVVQNPGILFGVEVGIVSHSVKGLTVDNETRGSPTNHVVEVIHRCLASFAVGAGT